MSIKVKRNGKQVELQCFSNDEIVKYLTESFNAKFLKFRLVAKTRIHHHTVMAKYRGVYFMINSKETWIELCFDKQFEEEMTDVIKAITRWSKFSHVEPTFYVEIDNESSRTIIFENGNATIEHYKERFGDELKITKF